MDSVPDGQHKKGIYHTGVFLHGTSIGGLIVDSGNFDWEAVPERQPSLNTPDSSYSNAIWTEAVKPLGSNDN